MNFTHNGRQYAVTETQEMANMSAHLKSRGFDGVTYFAESKATGRQRRDFTGMFFRSAKTGEFVSAI